MENENIIQNEVPAVEPKEVKEEKSCEHKKCKCCLNTILNIVAIVGVIVLFVLYFTGRSCSKSGKTTKAVNSNIAFVNSDTLLAKYDLVKSIKDSLLAKQTKASDSLEKLQKAYEYQVTNYQNKMKAKAYSIEQATKIEEGFTKQQEDLYALKEDLTNALTDENLKMTNLLQDSIINFLKRYNYKYKYDYILSYSKNSEILFASDSLDLTKDVLEGLNKEYKERKK